MSEYEAGVIVDGRYRLISRIGAGGMADVYLAEDLQLGREVALKLLHRRFAEDPGFVERFRREAQSAAALQHPNVVSVFDRGSFDGTYYIAMEYLEGRTLKQLIREESPLAPERAIDFTIQILKAARFAHRRGVIHRDLKPHNVIVDATDHAKVTDFGIARAGASDMTETGSIMGTAQYLSPEQAQGYPVSAPSDLYSVAIVLYEMLTGRVPFDGESAVTIALKQVSEAPIAPSQLNPAVPKPLEQVVLWALNKDPADRPADADEFITALEQARELMNAPPTDVTAAMRAVSPVTVLGAGAAAVAGAPATALVPASAAAITPYGSAANLENGAGRAGDTGNGNGKRDDGGGWRGMWPWIAGLLVILLLAGGVLTYLLTRPSKVLVPDVTGLSLPVAQAHLRDLGLTGNPIYEVNQRPQNQVIGQSIDGGVSVTEGSVINLEVSDGPGTVDVPTVASLNQKMAVKVIEKAGLKVSNIIYQSSQNVPKGQAISTSPPAGTSLAHGVAVALYISKGIRVPDVSGDTVGVAQRALSNFKVKVVTQLSPGVKPGTVFMQTPAANSFAKSGSVVTIYVAKKPSSNTVVVPDVVGYTEVGATNTLHAHGFKVAYRNKVVKSANQVGDVVRQLPIGASTAPRGSTVIIYIGKLASHTGTTTTGTNTTPTTT